MNKLMEKLQVIALAFAENKYITAITGSFQVILPIVIVGGISNLFANLGIDVWQNFLSSTGLGSVFSTVATVTFGYLAVLLSFFIAYNFAASQKGDAVQCGIISVIAFFTLIPYTSDADGVSAVVSDPMGYQGMFLAILVGFLTVGIYDVFMKYKLYMKMPAGVPKTVERSFAALTPALFILLLFGVIAALMAKTSYGSVNNFIYSN